MDECYQCKHWNNEQWIMNKYGEGCGICMMDGQVRFCSHKCPFVSPLDEEEITEELEKGKRNEW